MATEKKKKQVAAKAEKPAEPKKAAAKKKKRASEPETLKQEGAEPDIVAEQDGVPEEPYDMAYDAVDTLRDRHLRFAMEYAKDMMGAKAAIRAGYSVGGAAVTASRLLRRPDVRNMIGHIVLEMHEQNKDAHEIVMQSVKARILADPNEIVEHRRNACRYCWGESFKYQFTPAEYRKHEKKYEQECLKAKEKGMPEPAFDPLGGIGYDKRQGANPECPECFGDGLSEMFIKDTRHLSKPALMIYEGVKVGREGMEAKIASRDKSIELLARHAKFFEDNGGGVTLNVVSSDDLDKVYEDARKIAEKAKAAMQQRVSDLEE